MKVYRVYYTIQGDADMHSTPWYVLNRQEFDDEIITSFKRTMSKNHGYNDEKVIHINHIDFEGRA